MTKLSFWQRLWIAAKDYWAAAGIIISIAFGVYDFLARFTDLGLITPDWLLPAWLILFTLSCIFTIIQYRKKKRDLEGEKLHTVGKPQEIGKIEAESNFQSGGQNIAAGTVNIYGRGDNKKGNMPVLAVFDETMRLMNKAIDDTNWFARVAELESDPSRVEKFRMAFQTGKDFRDYYNNHKHYYSVEIQTLLSDLLSLMGYSLRKIFHAYSSGERELWIELNQNFSRQSELLRERIVREFQKRLAQLKLM